MGLDPKSKPADALRHDIMHAMSAIQQLTDLIEVQPWYAPSIRARRGRMFGFDILVGDVNTVVRAPMPKAEILPMVGLQGWTPPGSDATDEDIEF